MTCIVGLEHDGCVTIGADSIGVAGNALTVRSDPKVFFSGPFLIGFCGSFRMRDLLRYRLKLTLKRASLIEGRADLDEYMVTTFIEAVRECFADGGFTEIVNKRESGGSFLVGIMGRLYVIGSDFQVGRHLSGYAAIGSGAPIARGSLHSTASFPPVDRVLCALRAAEHHATDVTGPFTVETA